VLMHVGVEQLPSYRAIISCQGPIQWFLWGGGRDVESSHGRKTINVGMLVMSFGEGACESSAYGSLGMLCLNDLILVVRSTS
jgi:hypothetical protein